ncbi:hypothetical protein SLEP1_g41199 [Rubroshorea leprosula]|uniref:Guanylate kinase 1 n=1 Tax=Rubroshorea leprosula TaxID=152421 RepID=A0AAV5L5R5_9ROSI|nr:hypothetical protein SLEP1_g41199 [Rubroshorea leprosula]
MGEACVADNWQNGSPKGIVLNSKDEETRTTIGDKVYVIGRTDDGSTSSLGVKIYEKSTRKWVIPTVLGTRPATCKGHSAVLWNEDRIMIIKKGSNPDDCIWFLEVDTKYVKEHKGNLGIEVVAWSKGVRGDAEKPVVISGPSGVGKGTLISMLMEQFPSMFGFSVSHTTRAPRGMEKDGVHYHFTERSVMEKEIRDGKFLEFAEVHGNLYGTSIEAVEAVADSGKRCILDIDVQGARQVRASSLEAIFIFICPPTPSMEKLEERLRARGTETKEQILKRLQNAEPEIEQGKSSGTFGHILYNDNLNECYENLKKLLGLDGSAAGNHKTTLEGIDLPLNHSVSQDGNKIQINSETPELGKTSKNLIVLDVSKLKGGAPWRTGGLNVNAINSFSDGLNGINNLS